MKWVSGMGAISLELRRLGREADYSPSSVEIENERIYTSDPPYILLSLLLMTGTSLAVAAALKDSIADDSLPSKVEGEESIKLYLHFSIHLQVMTFI
jgi:hypothetical protein